MLRKIRFGNLENENGNASAFILMALVCIVAFTYATLWRGVEHHQRIKIQLSADTAAHAGALWQARSLNLIAGCNLGIVICVMAALAAAAILIGLVVCTAIPSYTAVVCAELLTQFYKPLMEVAEKSYKTAIELSNIARQIADYSPLLSLGYAVLAVKAYQGENKRDMLPLPYPFMPEVLGGNRKNKSTLSLHLVDGDISGLIRAFLESLLSRITQGTAKSTALGILEKLFPGGGTKPMNNAAKYPNPLELSDEFRDRIKFSVLVYEQMAEKEIGLYAMAQSTVFLLGSEWGEEDLATMNWHSRLVSVDVLEDWFPQMIAERIPQSN